MTIGGISRAFSRDLKSQKINLISNVAAKLISMMLRGHLSTIEKGDVELARNKFRFFKKAFEASSKNT